MGMVPVKVKSFRESPKILGVANAFSGGVFLAIALMHIMPEQTEAYSNADINKDLRDYPMPYLLLVAGYTFILVIDRVLFDSHDILEDDHGHGKVGEDATASRISIVLRKSIHQIMDQNEGAQSEKMLEEAIRKSMS